MAVSSFAEALRAPAGYAPPKVTPPPAAPTPLNLPAIPAAAPLPVTNPTTQPRESFLRGLLDPSNNAYIGNKYRPELQQAGRNLQSGLEGYGNYSFSQDASGRTTATKDAQGQPGEKYKGAYFDARSQAAAQGMLYSRTAEDAIGTAWHRLGEQERGMFNQYAANESEILSRQASEFTGITSELLGLYGQDAQYAIDNPPAPPVAPTAAIPVGTTPQAVARFPAPGAGTRFWGRGPVLQPATKPLPAHGTFWGRTVRY